MESQAFYLALETPVSYVEDFLYIGSRRGAREKDLLKEVYGIKRVVQIQDSPVPPFYPDDFQYLCYGFLDDDFTDNIVAILPEALNFIKQGQDNLEPVFVHCNAGVSRSASVVLCYLRAKYQLSYREALSRLVEARACVGPNDFFAERLEKLETEDLMRMLGTKQG
jgi:hypothetical protein